MNEKLPRIPWPMLAAATTLLVVALYVVGYFILGDHVPAGRWIVRGFTSRGLAVAYTPIGWSEAKLRRRTVYLTMPPRSSVDHGLIFHP